MYVIIVHTYLQNCKANAVNVLPSIGKPLLWNIQDQTESRKSIFIEIKITCSYYNKINSPSSQTVICVTQKYC